MRFRWNPPAGWEVRTRLTGWGVAAHLAGATEAEGRRLICRQYGQDALTPETR